MSQEFENEVWDLVKQKWLYPYKNMCDLEKFNETFPSKNKFYSSLSGKELVKNSFLIFSKFGINFKLKL